ncbi:MAG: sulfite exporter TauE/SafE family protein [Erysipelotrichaceae bacterium]|nr:sulfite exporter TauE/SafE family protein [Erysipelotrichaceae bacterium]
MEFILLLVGFLASVVGAICGIGGGVIIKPVLDSIGFAKADTISFLSGLTVLCMSGYNMIKSFLAKEKMDLETGTPLAFGAAIGGIAGKQLFNMIKNSSPNPSFVGGVQAASLAVATFLTLIYTLKSDRIETKHVKSKAACALIGLILGLMSSFMGIGGGPFNLAVLSYFFSMRTKEAAASSLYVIMVSQIFSLLTTLVTKSVPYYKISWVIVMAASGIIGGIAGRKINKKLSAESVRKLFIAFLFVIIAISIYNSYNSFSK